MIQHTLTAQQGHIYYMYINILLHSGKYDCLVLPKSLGDVRKIWQNRYGFLDRKQPKPYAGAEIAQNRG